MGRLARLSHMFKIFKAHMFKIFKAQEERSCLTRRDASEGGPE